MRKKILVVAEHDSFRQLLGSYLSGEFETTVVRNNLDAMIWLHRGHQPDLILSANESKETGMLRLLQTSGFFSAIPVFVLGNQEHEHAAFWLQLGARAYLSKPFSPPCLLDHINRIIN